MTPPVLPMDKCGFFAQIYVVINPRSGCLVQVRTVILVILVSHSCAKVGRLQEMGYLNLLVEGVGDDMVSTHTPHSCLLILAHICKHCYFNYNLRLIY